MESLKDMIDVNTVVGDAVEAEDGTVIIPISRVSVGFVSGGGEYECCKDSCLSQGSEGRLPFAGGAGAGISLCPMGFLVVGKSGVRMLPAHVHTAVDRVIDMAPQIVAEVKRIFTGDEEEQPVEVHVHAASPAGENRYHAASAASVQPQPDQPTTKSEL